MAIILAYDEYFVVINGGSYLAEAFFFPLQTIESVLTGKGLTFNFVIDKILHFDSFLTKSRYIINRFYLKT